jgi:hypothetical protein
MSMNARELITKALESGADKRKQAQLAHEARLIELAAEAVGRIDDSLPEWLRPYVVYAGEYPDNENARLFWKPSFFQIQAPGLAPMAFIAKQSGKSLQVQSIRVGGKKYDTDWTAAITDAATEFERRQSLASA